MAGKDKTVFFCKECGYESSKWQGQCPGCREWNTLVEEPVSRQGGQTRRPAASGRAGKAEPQLLKEVVRSSEERVRTEIGELDRVLGGGIVAGSLVLVGGDPGIGKSTLLLQMCGGLSQRDYSVLYISGEESLQQIRLRADRLDNACDRLWLLSETSLDAVEEAIERQKPQIVVIDSIQTMYREDISASPGSVSQVRECRSCDEGGRGGRAEGSGAHG